MVAAIEVKGLKELNRALLNVGDDLSDLKNANEALGKIVADRAAALVPVRTGKLKKTIKAVRSDKKVRIAAGSASVRYAPIIEFGWGKRNIRPQSYLYKAAGQLREEIKTKFEDNIKELIRKYDLE